MAVAVAQDATPVDESTGDAPAVVNDTSDDATGPIFFSDEIDNSEDADDDEAPEAPNADDAVDDADDADDDVDGADDGQEASSLMKRASRKTTQGASGKTIAISSQKDFCLFLPSKIGGDIAKNERRAEAFCIKPHNRATPGARTLPKGFIKTAHLKHNRGKHDYVQVTGRIDRTKYKLSKKDQGGQYGKILDPLWT